MLRARGNRAGGSYAENASNAGGLADYTMTPKKEHTHLDAFLRDQISTSKSNKAANRSTVSASSSRRNNQLIEMAASAQYKKRKQSDAGSGHNVMQKSGGTEHIVAAVNMMRLSNYQNDPLAATMGTRSLGLAKLNVSKKQVEEDNRLFQKSVKVQNHNEGMKIDTLSHASSKQASERILNNISDVEQALYRKKISDTYHTSVPKFMRSQGPFAVYDHSAHKGDNSFITVGGVNELALTRFKNEVVGVQQTREKQKQQFYSAIDYMDRMEFIKQQDRKKQNRVNSEFLRRQIAEKQLRRETENQVEGLYYKPHFGPEETLDQIQTNMDNERAKKDFLMSNLSNQINQASELNHANLKQEKHADRKFIRATTNAQILENTAIAKKE